MEARFPIGTQYLHKRGKVERICTVVDILKTYNHTGELVSIRYVSEHEFLGQKVLDRDVVDATIARNLIGTPQ